MHWYNVYLGAYDAAHGSDHGSLVKEHVPSLVISIG